MFTLRVRIFNKAIFKCQNMILYFFYNIKCYWLICMSNELFKSHKIFHLQTHINADDKLFIMIHQQ